MFCKNCGKQIEDTSKFCIFCGNVVSSQGVMDQEIESSPEEIHSHRIEPTTEMVSETEAFDQQTHGAIDVEHTPITPGINQQSSQFGDEEQHSSNDYLTPPITPSYGGSGNDWEEPPKKKKGLKIAIIALVAVFAIGALVGVVFGKNLKRMILGPEKSYLALEGKYLKDNLSKGIDNIFDWSALDTRSGKLGYKMDLSVNVEIEDLVDPSIAEIINNLSVSVTQIMDNNSKDPQIFADIKALIKGEDVVSANFFMDNKKMVLSSPEITDKKFLITREFANTVMNDESTGANADEIWSALENAMTMETINRKDLIGPTHKLADVILKYMKDVTWEKSAKPNGDVGIDQSFERYTVKMTGEQLLGMTKELLSTVKEDSNWYDVVHSLYGVSSSNPALLQMVDAGNLEMFKDEESWKTAIDGALEALDAVDKDEAKGIQLTQYVYIGKDGSIHGREIYVEDKDTDDKFSFNYFNTPVDKQNRQVFILENSDKGKVEMENTWSESNGKNTGEMVFTLPNMPELTVSYKDYKKEKFGPQNVATGEFTVHLPAEAAPVTSVVINSTLNKGRYESVVSAEGLGKMNLGIDMLDKKAINLPSYKESDLTDLSKIQDPSELMDEKTMENAQKIIQKLGIPLDGLMGGDGF